MRIVFDTYALMAYFNREASYKQVYRLITETLQRQHDTYISIINLGELFYIRYRKNSPTHAESAIRFVRRIGIHVEPATDERVMRAARVKATFPLSYADTFAASLAQELNATLVTGDPEYRPLANTIPILWLQGES